MVASNVLDATGDARLAMEYIGDKDLKQMNSYLKRRDNRLERASQALSAASLKPFLNRSPVARRRRATESAPGNRGATTTSATG
jgi:hypothetical protein